MRNVNLCQVGTVNRLVAAISPWPLELGGRARLERRFDVSSPLPRTAICSGSRGFPPPTSLAILDEAEPWVAFNRGARKADERLAGLTQINAFFENSTRTLFSFEIAGKRLGAQVSNFHPAASSVRKGESLIDTALTLNAMRPDILVIRHEAEGAAADVAAVMDCPVINAGDGTGEHPTQALLDALTIRRRFGRIDGLEGRDLRRHPPQPGRRIRTCARCPCSAPRCGWSAPSPAARALPAGVAAFTDFDEGIEGADVVMMLRIQRERMAETFPDALGDYHARYGLTRARLERARARRDRHASRAR